MSKEKLKQRLIELADEWDNQDEIDHLFDYFIANGVTIRECGEWIPVTERLPKLYTKVLCCGRKGGRFIAEMGSWGRNGNLYWTKKDGKGCPTVTHWMPLPEPPEAEKGDEGK